MPGGILLAKPAVADDIKDMKVLLSTLGPGAWLAGALLLAGGGAAMIATCAGARQGPKNAAASPGAVAEMTQVIAGDADAGWERYIESCSACHGPDGQGMPNQGVSLRASRFIAERNDAELFAFIKAGRQPTEAASVTRMLMPARGGNAALTDAQIRDIVAHLRMLQPKPAVTAGGR
jgi:mono/diheme cytochrome c family protein